MIITIGRQYGSGGRALGEKLAQRLGYDFYDENLVDMAAKKSNMSQEVLRQVDEKATRSLLYSIATGQDLRNFNSPMVYEMPINDKLFIAQSEIIKELAKKGNCVIVGRCADYVLQNENVQCLNLFVFAALEKRIERIMRLYDLSREQAKSAIVKTEKRRKTYYNYYTNNDWGRMTNYHLCLDTGVFDVDSAVDMLCAFINKKQ